MMREQWKMHTPKLIISVSGGKKNFAMNPRLTALFKQGLMKAADNTGRPILSSLHESGSAVI